MTALHSLVICSLLKETEGEEEGSPAEPKPPGLLGKPNGGRGAASPVKPAGPPRRPGQTPKAPTGRPSSSPAASQPAAPPTRGPTPIEPKPSLAGPPKAAHARLDETEPAEYDDDLSEFDEDMPTSMEELLEWDSGLGSLLAGSSGASDTPNPPSPSRPSTNPRKPCFGQSQPYVGGNGAAQRPTDFSPSRPSLSPGKPYQEEAESSGSAMRKAAKPTRPQRRKSPSSRDDRGPDDA
eukprot:scaffold336584_cov28-Prasinocladus_malaysianus.AAC.1